MWLIRITPLQLSAEYSFYRLAGHPTRRYSSLIGYQLCTYTRPNSLADVLAAYSQVGIPLVPLGNILLGLVDTLRVTLSIGQGQPVEVSILGTACQLVRFVDPAAFFRDVPALGAANTQEGCEATQDAGFVIHDTVSILDPVDRLVGGFDCVPQRLRQQLLACLVHIPVQQCRH